VGGFSSARDSACPYFDLVFRVWDEHLYIVLQLIIGYNDGNSWVCIATDSVGDFVLNNDAILLLWLVPRDRNVMFVVGDAS